MAIWSILSLVALLLLNSVAIAQVNEPTESHLQLDSLNALKSFETIRVKIFPHERNFAPHFVDLKKDAVTLESPVPCSIHEAKAQANPIDGIAKGSRYGTFVTRATNIPLDANLLRNSLIINCPGPFVLKRETDKRSFTYLGEIYVAAEDNLEGTGKNLLIVHTIPLESYLRGVVPAEVSAGWPTETLKSQAVAARSYAVFHISYSRKTFPDRLYDVDDSIVYQAFTGISDVHERTDMAVRETTGEILLYQNGIIQAYYHADSGGMTASAEHAFKTSVPYCVPKQEPYDPQLINSQWQFTYTLVEINEKLKIRGLIGKAETIVNLSIEEIPGANQGKRVNALTLIFTDGTSRQVSVHDFKRAVNLGSTFFSAAVLPSNLGTIVEFTGKGSGHGVGLNQMGAKVLAEHYAWDYAKILLFYYTGTKMCTLANGSAIGDERRTPSCTQFVKI